MVTSELGHRRYFKVQRLVLKIIGINLTTSGKIVKYPFYTYAFIFSLALHVVAMVHYAYVNAHNLKALTDVLGTGIQAFMAVFKVIMLLNKRKQAASLVKKLWALNKTENAAHSKIIGEENTRDVVLCSIYFVVVVLTATTGMIAPFIIAAALYLKGKEVLWIPPFMASYFIDYQRPINFFFVWLWCVISTHLGAFGSIVVDSLFSWFANNIIAHFRIVKLNFEEVAIKQGQHVTTESIICCIQEHRQIISIAQDLNKVYGRIIFVKFTISCAQICFLAYRFSKGGEVSDIAFQFLLLNTVALQMIMYCINGQRIEDESGSIAAVVYSSFEWHQMQNQKAKLLLLPMIRSQKIFNLTGVFFTVNIALFVWVFRTAISFFTLLVTIDKK